jgi:hypothetical protein
MTERELTGGLGAGADASRGTAGAGPGKAGRLTAVPVREAEDDAVFDAIEAVRCTLRRFKAANAAAARCAPQAILRVDEDGHDWTLTLNGFRPAYGKTLDAAFKMLADPPDAAFKRRRAAALRESAERLEREAEAMEVGTGAGAVGSEQSAVGSEKPVAAEGGAE